jgi:uncharacterized protein YdeI (YjbR/CyaY-like superfamily)
MSAPDVAVPDDLAETLEAHPEQRAAFEMLPPSHRREYVTWIEEAKKPETRAKRIAKAVEMLREGDRR